MPVISRGQSSPSSLSSPEPSHSAPGANTPLPNTKPGNILALGTNILGGKPDLQKPSDKGIVPNSKENPSSKPSSASKTGALPNSSPHETTTEVGKHQLETPHAPRPSADIPASSPTPTTIDKQTQSSGNSNILANTGNLLGGTLNTIGGVANGTLGDAGGVASNVLGGISRFRGKEPSQPSATPIHQTGSTTSDTAASSSTQDRPQRTQPPTQTSEKATTTSQQQIGSSPSPNQATGTTEKQTTIALTTSRQINLSFRPKPTPPAFGSHLQSATIGSSSTTTSRQAPLPLPSHQPPSSSRQSTMSTSSSSRAFTSAGAALQPSFVSDPPSFSVSNLPTTMSAAKTGFLRNGSDAVESGIPSSSSSNVNNTDTESSPANPDNSAARNTITAPIASASGISATTGVATPSNTTVITTSTSTTSAAASKKSSLGPGHPGKEDTPPHDSDNKSSGLSAGEKGAIIGGSIAAAVSVITLILVLVLFVCRSRRRRQRAASQLQLPANMINVPSMAGMTYIPVFPVSAPPYQAALSQSNQKAELQTQNSLNASHPPPFAPGYGDVTYGTGFQNGYATDIVQPALNHDGDRQSALAYKTHRNQDSATSSDTEYESAVEDVHPSGHLQGYAIADPHAEPLKAKNTISNTSGYTTSNVQFGVAL
ncbi:hypothetical protein BDN70DRAFT_870117 [Pholiota conissans]|uniref:Uncharacterized protein n=1 Tax=Pholiota conissans TaxID=109636 RepID=A0A9P5ZHJ1_9AGAR|nr:hypothetical protein BDN70DRAFT_870117 [Pholiota conissans]